MKKSFLEEQGVTYQDQVRAVFMMLFLSMVILILWLETKNENRI